MRTRSRPGSDCQSHTLLDRPGDSGRKLTWIVDAWHRWSVSAAPMGLECTGTKSGVQQRRSEMNCPPRHVRDSSS